MKLGVDSVEDLSQRNLILNRCYRIGAAVPFCRALTQNRRWSNETDDPPDVA
jgi:hypothetical protein